MRREQFSLDVSNVGWLEADDEPETPTLAVSFGGDREELEERVLRPDGERLAAEETDVTIRLHGTPEDADAEGVIAITNRISGEYVIEFNVNVEDALAFTRAARRYAERTEEGSRYRIRITCDGADIATYEKRTLLVYSGDGELLRQHSLIPSGVEI